MLTLKFASIFLILLITIVAGAYPFYKKMRTSHGFDFPAGEALASGIFLGVGLITMLSEAEQGFLQQHIHYPLAFLLAGIAFLVLLLVEHMGREIYEHATEASPVFAVLAVAMLSTHGFLAGVALGLSRALSVFTLILLAILAHKWAESFALAVQINKSNLAMKTGILLFTVFALMVPIGIIFGAMISQHLGGYPLIAPIFEALAAGTFIYFGTLHGLKRAVMIEKCCDLRRFGFVIIGFAIMAIVAIWT